VAKSTCVPLDTGTGEACYAPSHEVGVIAPKGGTSCANCKFVLGQYCGSTPWVEWFGSKRIPVPVDEYCCDFWEVSLSVTKIRRRP
jgi:hypothetical protein